jgi:ELWxxDGT repeat protein
VRKRSPVWISIAAWGVVALAPAAAQGPAVLVKDIATGPAVAGRLHLDTPPVVIGDQAFFAGDDGFVSRELWATDGTPRGTRLVADLCPGRCSGQAQAFTPSGNLLFFVAGNTATGDNSFWVWRSDGTDDGTYPLADLAIDVFGSAGPIGYLSPFRGGAVFLVRAGGRNGYDLWRSDGTRAGTRAFFALPGTFGLATPDNRKHPFLSEPGSEGVRFNWQDAPWVTDGTAQGTHPVAELPIRLCYEGGWIALDHRVIYAGEDFFSKGCEPWTTDGTVTGTHRLRDINPGLPSSVPFDFVSTRNGVYFAARDQYGRSRLWKSDGTTEGTIRVRTSRPERPLNKAAIIGAVGSRIYFAADDGVHGLELWRTDGNPATTQMVVDLTPGAASSQLGFGLAADDGLYFGAAIGDATDGFVFHTTGTAASTVRIEGTGNAGMLATLGDRLLLEVPTAGEGSALAVTDATAGSPRILFHGESAPSSFPTDLSSADHGLLFTADDGIHGGEVWRTDGRRSGTRLLADFMSSDNSFDRPRLFATRGGVFISVVDFGHDSLLVWSDGSAETPRTLVHDPALAVRREFVETGEGAAFFVERFAEFSGVIELWGSDGTPAGTGKLALVDEGPDPYDAAFVTAGPAPGSATFMFQSFASTKYRSSQLFSTDGTAGGTRALGPLGLGVHTQVLGIIAAAGRSFLVLYEEFRRSASKLWVNDGTPDGTSEVFRINDPFDHSFISELDATADRLYFTGDDAVGGRELWATDGTREGTARVADIVPGRGGSNPSDFFGFGNLLFFAADDGAHGGELWVTDGSAAGTRQIEIRPGPRGSFPHGFTAIGNRVVFAADDGTHGLEIWTSDGTPAGTRLAADVLPGRLGSDPSGFALFGTDLFFAAGRPSVGYELFRVPRSVLDAH